MKVDIKGDIIPNDYKRVYNWLQWDGTCPKDIHDAISEANGDELAVYVASGGGNVYAGMEMYSALRDYPGQVKIHVVSHAHSAASLMTCAGHCVMRPGALMMIHQVSYNGVSGNSADMQRIADQLSQHDEAIVSVYEAKTGLPRDKLLDMMRKETYLTAQEAVDLGFADEVADEALRFVAAASHILTPEQVEKIQAMIPKTESNALAIERERLKLLNLEARK